MSGWMPWVVAIGVGCTIGLFYAIGVVSWRVWRVVKNPVPWNAAQLSRNWHLGRIDVLVYLAGVAQRTAGAEVWRALIAEIVDKERAELKLCGK